ncbi:UDP-glucuronic acid decarboxylase 1 [Porphyridium purpureum]|uniref:UDP-glucuronate decarboxylase n=1 Tax=Porphyridium purpureum TaxID=35688 RepID=A0A5J4YU17_PORPP|nr:UDP-glucuronic acid decarboxylase 1 [Porphyridium purpureum]|eukprot:POR4905..scf229_5
MAGNGSAAMVVDVQNPDGHGQDRLARWRQEHAPNRPKKHMRVLVTGGAGFIGSHLCDRLISDGHEVICLDNLFTGKKSNVAHLMSNPNFEFVRHDVTQPYEAEVDAIYHFACPASPVHYKYNAIKTLKTSMLGTMNMLGLAKRTGARILLASTSEVYGDPLQHPQTEEYWGNVNPIGVRSCYDEGKRIAETMAFDYHRQHHVDIAVVRIFNTYGPRMVENDGRVVSNFVGQVIRGEPLTIYGDGKQTRSFCYVSDLVDGIVRLFESGLTGPINCGNPGEFTMIELAEMILELTGSKQPMNFLPATPDDPMKRQPDITKAKTLLGWEPKVPLREGLKPMIDDFRHRIENALYKSRHGTKRTHELASGHDCLRLLADFSRPEK